MLLSQSITLRLEVVLSLALFSNGRTNLIQPKAVVDFLQEKIAAVESKLLIPTNQLVWRETDKDGFLILILFFV